jgi:hypothetical protein
MLNLDSIVIGLSHRAKHGKDTVANAIIAARGKKYSIEKIAFADKLREEVNEAFETAGNWLGVFMFVKKLGAPDWVVYDPNGEVTEQYPYGKQRTLLQWWGTEYRRAQDSYYWVKELQRKVRASTAQVVLITDMRFQNEFSWVKSQGGITVKVEREGFDNGINDHPSEHQLDNAEFDATILHGEGQVDHLKQCGVELFDMIVGWKSAPPEEELDFTVPEEVINETQSV